jgi:hypothetical protein
VALHATRRGENAITTERDELVERDTYPQPEHGWTCFHCGETFHAVGLAAVHFGSLIDGEPACRLNQKERGLAFQLRQAEEQLARYRAEDSDTDRAMHAMRADHVTELKREEEKGYARGLRDGLEHSASREAALAAMLKEISANHLNSGKHHELRVRADAILSDTSTAASRLLNALKECGAPFVLHEQRLGENKPIDYERIAREFVRRIQIADAALAPLTGATK